MLADVATVLGAVTAVMVATVETAAVGVVAGGAAAAERGGGLGGEGLRTGLVFWGHREGE